MKAWLIALGLLLSGCATTDVARLDDTHYAPTKHVEILLDKPQQPYKVIAVLETHGALNMSQTSLLNALRKKARSVGADAVLLIADTSQQTSPGLMFNPWLGGYETLPGGVRPGVRALAIKYTAAPAPVYPPQKLPRNKKGLSIIW